MIKDTPAQHKMRVHDHAEKTLGTVVHAAQAATVVCETVQVEHQHHYRIIEGPVKATDQLGGRGRAAKIVVYCDGVSAAVAAC